MGPKSAVATLNQALELESLRALPNWRDEMSMRTSLLSLNLVP